MDIKHLNPKVHRIMIGGKYLLTKRLGAGSFGQIYTAIRPDDRTSNFAIKLEKRTANAFMTLAREAKIISDMKNEFGFPILYDFGKEEDYNYMAINLLGQSLEKLFKVCNNKFSLKTVLMLGNQMLSRIETLHGNNFIHRDIKPENFCVGTGQSKKTLYLIDFGLARNYIDCTGKHILFKTDKGLVGTARYASINAHLGHELSRRDDLEEIGYVLIYFLQGSLPWQNTKGQDKQAKYQIIKDCKMSTPIDILCKGLPIEFSTYMNYVKSLGFTDEPDYDYLKNLFKTLLAQNGWELDYEYDWLPASRSSVINKKEESPIIQTVHVHQYKTVALQKAGRNQSGSNERSAERKENKTNYVGIQESQVQKNLNGKLKENSRKLQENEIEKQDILKDTKIQKVVKIISEKFKDKIKKRNDKTNQISRYEVATSYHSSKAINYTQGLVEGEIPAEISIHNAPNDNIEQTMTFAVKKKDFSHGISGFFNSSDSLDSPENSQNIVNQGGKPISSFAVVHLQKDNRVPRESLYKKSTFHHKHEEDMNPDDFGENLSDNSICEWEGGISLAQMVQKQKFNVSFKEKIGSQ